MNLLEGLFEEMNRNRELLKEYESIGDVGKFGAGNIKFDIELAEKAIAEGNIVAELKCYSKLKGNK